MLSPELEDFARRSEKGFDLGRLPAGTFLELKTNNHTFWVVVVDPSSGKVALESTHPQLREAQFFYHQGATAGGSAIKIGWVGVGLRLQMRPIQGGLLTTSPLKSFKFADDDAHASEIVAAAQASEPEGTITAEEFDREVAELITKNFPPENQQEIRAFVDEFCPEGKGIMLGILDRALEAGKLAEALTILRQDFDEHWCYRPKEVRGSFVNEQDVFYVERAYERLGIPSPTSTQE